MKKIFGVFILLSFISGQAFAAQAYAIDKAHSSIMFSIAHLMISRTTGGFTDYDAEILFDADDLANSKFDVTIKAASIDTDNEARDNHLRGADFFETDQYPLISFKSRKVEGSTLLEDGKVYLVTGNLTMKDVTKEVEIPVMVRGPIDHPMGGGKAIGLSARLTVNRQEYNINFNKKMDNGGLLVGDMVDVNVEMEARAK